MRTSLQRSLFSGYKERENYYKTSIVKDTVESTCQFLNLVLPANSRTFHDIIFRDIAWGSTEKEITRKMGSPRFKFHKINDLANHQILFFKTEVSGQAAILQFHLFENQLYFLHMDFRGSLSHDLTFIQEALHRKYSIETFNPGRNSSFEDYFQNKLIIEHNVHLNIYYVSGNLSIKQKLEKQRLYVQNHKAKTTEEKENLLFKLL